MKAVQNFVKGMRYLHALAEENDGLSLFNEKRYPTSMFLRLPNAPANPSIIEREKRQMINRNSNTSVMITLMKS